MKEMNPVCEERYEINVDIHGIRDGPRLGRLRVLNTVRFFIVVNYNYYTTITTRKIFEGKRKHSNTVPSGCHYSVSFFVF